MPDNVMGSSPVPNDPCHKSHYGREFPLQLHPDMAGACSLGQHDTPPYHDVRPKQRDITVIQSDVLICVYGLPVQTADPASMPVHGHRGSPYIWNRELQLRFALEDGTLSSGSFHFSDLNPHKCGRLNAVWTLASGEPPHPTLDD